MLCCVYLVLPLLEVNPKLHVQAIDCARSAVEILR